MTRRKAPHERQRPGPKPGFRQVQAVNIAPTTTPVLDRPVLVTARPSDPLQRHRDMQSMDEPELRAYALQVGVSKRDAQTLPMDRLRVNCVHVINALIEEL